MAELPRGTVTLLFTDVEGSTRLLERLGPDRYAVALALHRELLREAFRARRGYEVDYEGDAFFVAFATAEDAVAAAVDAQQRLRAASWPEGLEFRVRIGIHTGEPLTVPPKYVGIDVHRAARIMAAGHGGQTLLSQATRKRLDDEVPLLDLGEHRLKDLLQPERLYQLQVEGLPNEFAALRTLGNRPTNLPVQPNPLIGRERELRTVEALLRRDDLRLLTLTGTAGTGKTRLALQAAADLIEDFRSGVFFVGLAPVTDPDLVLPAIARTLALREVPGEALADTLAAYLEEKELLLLLDNFEQVVVGAPGVAKLLSVAPRLKLLATSRERLALGAERTYEVPPLALPDASAADAGALIENEAVALFCARAEAASPGFALASENARAVAEICVRLDGLPLAIELAAARMTILAPQALLMRLDRRLQLLTGGVRDADERQRTLRRAIEWSCELLSDPERTLFARLGVFVGGCRMDAAQAVCAREAEVRVDLDRFQSLVEKSLLRRKQDPDGEPRFWLLETIREYALEQLETSGEEDDVRQLHARHYLELAEAAALGLTGEKQQLWLERLEADHDNLRAALSAALAKEPEVALRLAAALGPFWFARAHFGEARKWLDAALRETATGEHGDRAFALYWAARMAGKQAEWELDLRLAREALTLFRTLEDREGCSLCLAELGWVAYLQGRYTLARSLCEEGVALVRRRPESRGLINALNNLAHTMLELGEPERAKTLYEEVLSICRDRGDTRGLAMVFQSLGAMTLEAKEYEEASILLEEGLRLARAVEPGLTLGYVVDLGMLALEQEKYGRALSMAKEALALSNEFGDKYGATYALELVGSLAAEQGEPLGAATLLSAARKLRAEIGRPMTAADTEFLEPRSRLARAQLGDAGWAEATARPLALEEAFPEATRVAARIEAKVDTRTAGGELSNLAR